MLQEASGRLSGRIDRAGAPAWFPHWHGETCVVVGSGPSAASVVLDPALFEFGARFIAVNTSFKLAPHADMVYACDYRWWKKFEGLPKFHGLKVSQDEVCQREAWGIKRVYADHQSDAIKVQRCGFIGWAGNSGFQAINLAAQAGVSKIILVGFDMTLDNGADHWHPPHGEGHPRPKAVDVARHARATDAAAETLEALGIRVFNTSMKSALQNYPKVSLIEALRA